MCKTMTVLQSKIFDTNDEELYVGLFSVLNHLLQTKLQALHKSLQRR